MAARLRRAWADPLWWAGTLALAATFAWAGIRTTTFVPDEELYVPLARWLPDHLPGSLFQMAVYQRGIQRLDTIALAPALGVARSFAAAHVIQALLFASTALPVALLAERLGLGRAGRLATALGAVAVPAAIVATSFLPDALAYPLFVWALWGVFRAIAEPSPRDDWLALALCAAAALARTQLVVLFALPLAAAVLAGPRALWREHRVLVVTGALGAVVLAAGGGHALLGGYSSWAARATPTQARDLALDLAHLGAEVAFVPLVLALPWLLGRDPFRATALAAIVLLAASLIGAGRDERYLLYFVPIVLLAAALSLRRRRPVAVAAAAVALGALAASVSWTIDVGPLERFVFPAETLLRPAGAAVLGAVVAAAGLAAALWPRAMCAAAAVSVAVALGLTIAGFGDGPGRFDGPSAAARGWVDAHAGGHTVAVVVPVPHLRDLVYWNASIKRVDGRMPVGTAPLPPGVTAGRPRAPELVVADGAGRGRVVARSGPLVLLSGRPGRVSSRAWPVVASSCLMSAPPCRAP